MTHSADQFPTWLDVKAQAEVEGRSSLALPLPWSTSHVDADQTHQRNVNGLRKAVTRGGALPYLTFTVPRATCVAACSAVPRLRVPRRCVALRAVPCSALRGEICGRRAELN